MALPEQKNRGSGEEKGQEDKDGFLLQGRHLQLMWSGVAWQEGVGWQKRKGRTRAMGSGRLFMQTSSAVTT